MNDLGSRPSGFRVAAALTPHEILACQMDPICAPERMSAKTAGPLASLLTPLVTQRDTGKGRWTLRAAGSARARAAWAAAADSAAAFLHADGGASAMAIRKTRWGA